ncbi:MAG: dCMP deaminase family protein [Clostridiales bacterium]|jgi:dCMP deaminase|nr:dCMP deaminase family protein [Clostridiales bacterium]
MILNWDDYFMGIALLSAKRSKDPNTSVGACIVNGKNQIVGVGYNGMPRGCDDKVFPWCNDKDNLNNKYLYVVHAELNAILNSTVPLDNCKMYVSLLPCSECSKAIIQSGIKKVIYLSDKYSHTDTVKASKKMLCAAGVDFEQLILNTIKIDLDFNH